MHFSSHRAGQTWLLRVSLVVLMSTLLVLACCQLYATHAARRAAAIQGAYQVTALVSNLKGVSGFVDPHLRNPWGLAHSASGPWWVANNGSHVATLLRGDGSAFSTTSPLLIAIPSPTTQTGSSPTAVLFNQFIGTSPNDFLVSANHKSGPGMFLFATEDGTLAGWNPDVDLTHAVTLVNRSASAVYKGLTFGRIGRDNFLYATNFRAGTVEVFDTHFRLVSAFTDSALAAQCRPGGPCFAPFGIQNIGGKLFVTFALQDKDRHDDVKGASNGFVDVFDTRGHLLKRFAARGPLNSPWGLALAPRNFGRFSGALLVGNFGDGAINAFDPRSGRFLGQISDQAGKPLRIAGLWSLAFGNGALAGKTNELFFTAGLNDEKDGLFGKIQALPVAAAASIPGEVHP